MKNHTKVTTSFDDSVIYISGNHQEVKNEVRSIARKEERGTDEYIIWR